MMKKFKFLGALFVGLIGLVSFGYCGYTMSNVQFNSQYGFVGYDFQAQYLDNSSKTFTPGIPGIMCVFLEYAGNGGILTIGGNHYDMINFVSYCTTESSMTLTTYGNYKYYYNFFAEDFMRLFFTNYTSEECQSEYSLMPISSCDSEYCELNGLCSVDPGSTMSELYINGINHLGAPIINISIPLEYQWDYLYTGDNMNINISGYNVDHEYIDNIIRTQSSKPSNEDFENIITNLVPLFVPGLVIILFLIFIFRFIKKIF